MLRDDAHNPYKNAGVRMRRTPAFLKHTSVQEIDTHIFIMYA